MKPLSPVLALCLLVLGTGFAGAEDAHSLFETRCGRCHGHAGDFARARLRIVDGTLRGKHTDIPMFLEGHFGRPSPAETASLVAMLGEQAESRGLFAKRCRICHGPAHDMARQALILEDGQLIGRYTGSEIRAFLSGHGRLDAPEADEMHDMLMRQLRE